MRNGEQPYRYMYNANIFHCAIDIYSKTIAFDHKLFGARLENAKKIEFFLTNDKIFVFRLVNH